MDNNQINFWLSINAENFATEVLPVIKSKLEQTDKNQMMFLQSASFENPSTILLIAIFLGWERFWLSDVALGILKIITGYGCGIWWLIDIFTAKRRTQKYNFRQFQKATSVVSDGVGTPNVVTTSTISETKQTIPNSEQYEFNAIPTVQNKNHFFGKIILIIVAIVILVGGSLIYLNWDSVSERLGMESNEHNSAELMNLINSQGGANNTAQNSIEDIFSKSRKAKEVVEESSIAKVEPKTVPQTEQRPTTPPTTPNNNLGINNVSSALSTQLLTEDDIRSMSKQDLRILRNEIYARHGYIFKSKDLRDYFSAKDWYHPQYSDVSNLLNTIEKRNVAFIQRHE